MITLKDLQRLIRTQYADNRGMKKAFNKMAVQNRNHGNKALNLKEIDRVLLSGGARRQSTRKRKKKEIFTYPEDWIDHTGEESDEDFDEDDEDDDGGEAGEEDEDGPVTKEEEAFLKKVRVKNDGDYVYEDDTDDDEKAGGEGGGGAEDLVDCVDRCLGKGEPGLQNCLIENCKVCDAAAAAPTTPSSPFPPSRVESPSLPDMAALTESLFDSDDDE